MTTLSLVIPQIGQPDTTEDVKVQNAFTAIQTVINGNLDSTNLAAATSQSAGVNASGQTVKGVSNIVTSESRTNVAFGTLTTPDQVTGIVLPSAGLLQIWYRAIWSSTVGNAGGAAIFLNSNQLVGDSGNASTPPVVPVGTPTTANVAVGLTTYGFGLQSANGAISITNDVTTGQILGVNGSGGACSVFAAAGTYTVSVQFKASSGTVQANSRRLYVQAISFA